MTELIQGKQKNIILSALRLSVLFMVIEIISYFCLSIFISSVFFGKSLFAAFEGSLGRLLGRMFYLQIPFQFLFILAVTTRTKSAALILMLLLYANLFLLSFMRGKVVDFAFLFGAGRETYEVTLFTVLAISSFLALLTLVGLKKLRLH